MSYGEAKQAIHSYQADLKEASFPTEDAKLLPKIGACGPCVNRSENQRRLFGLRGKSSGDLCMDPACFGRKEAAHWKKLQQSKELTLTEKALKTIHRQGPAYDSPFAKPDEYLGAKKLSQLLTKKERDKLTIFARSKEGGPIHQVLEKKAVLEILEADGRHKPSETLGSGAPKPSAAEQAKKLADRILDGKLKEVALERAGALGKLFPIKARPFLAAALWKEAKGGTQYETIACLVEAEKKMKREETYRTAAEFLKSFQHATGPVQLRALAWLALSTDGRFANSWQEGGVYQGAAPLWKMLHVRTARLLEAAQKEAKERIAKRSQNRKKRAARKGARKPAAAGSQGSSRKASPAKPKASAPGKKKASRKAVRKPSSTASSARKGKAQGRKASSSSSRKGGRA